MESFRLPWHRWVHLSFCIRNSPNYTGCAWWGQIWGLAPVKRYDISPIILTHLILRNIVVKCRYLRQRWISQSTFLITALLLWINLCVFGGYCNEGSDICKPSQSSNLFLIDTSDWTCQYIYAPDELASTGLLLVDATCFMILWGTNNKHVDFKAFNPKHMWLSRTV